MFKRNIVRIFEISVFITNATPVTIPHLMNAWVDFDTRPARLLPQIGPVKNLDFFLFLDKLDLGHRLLFHKLAEVVM